LIKIATGLKILPAKWNANKEKSIYQWLSGLKYKLKKIKLTTNKIQLLLVSQKEKF
jgi:hypothetical protein